MLLLTQQCADLAIKEQRSRLQTLVWLTGMSPYRSKRLPLIKTQSRSNGCLSMDSSFGPCVQHSTASFILAMTGPQYQ
jgi:hypothetical protein